MLNDSEKEIIKEVIHKLLLEHHILNDNILSIKDFRNSLSKAITYFAFRDGPIEDMHADPTKNITDEDMMILNKYMVDHIELILELLSENNFIDILIFSAISEFFCSGWDKPDPDKYRESYNTVMEFALSFGIPALLKKYFNNDNK